MNNNSIPKKIEISPPNLFPRIMSVWLRHYRVYSKNLISNGFPPFIEPLFFLVGIGLGLGKYVGVIDGVSFVQFLAAGIIMPPAMFTATFECTFGTFIRLEFDKIYDGMLSASINLNDLFIGEILFAGTKGLFFSTAVLIVVSLFGLITSPLALFAPVVGFFTGLMFAAFSLYITSFVTTINHFNFYFTGVITPIFFFSGIVFPLNNLPDYLKMASEIFPLTHSVYIVRAFCLNQFDFRLFYDVIYIVIFIVFFSYFAIVRLKKRMIN